MMKLLEKAKAFAKQKHAGQKRWKGEDYYEAHCLMVMQYLMENTAELFKGFTAWDYFLHDKKLTERIYCAAVLHDTLEDTDTTYEELVTEFGSMVADLVKMLTKEEDQSYLDYIVNISEGVGSYAVAAAGIKIADLRCNRMDLKKGSMKDKYDLAEYILLKKLKENV